MLQIPRTRGTTDTLILNLILFFEDEDEEVEVEDASYILLYEQNFHVRFDWSIFYVVWVKEGLFQKTKTKQNWILESISSVLYIVVFGTLRTKSNTNWRKFNEKLKNKPSPPPKEYLPRVMWQKNNFNFKNPCILFENQLEQGFKKQLEVTDYLEE